MKSLQIRKMTYAGVLLALAVLMPVVSGRLPEIGKRMSLMHIPVLLCGFLCGAPWGLAIGFIAPLLSSFLSGMPKIFPDAAVMAFELAVYGCAAGVLYRLLPRKPWSVYAALIAAMIAGRIMYGLVYLFLAGTGLVQVNEALAAFIWTRAVVKPLPGIILHIILIPVLVMALERAGLSLNK